MNCRSKVRFVNIVCIISTGWNIQHTIGVPSTYLLKSVHITMSSKLGCNDFICNIVYSLMS